MNEFKLIVAGGRDFADYALLSQELLRLAEGTYANQAVSIVSGLARGADALGTKFATEVGVQLYEFPAEWDRYGKRAGFIRNLQMGESAGTKNMIHFMKALGKPTHVITY